MGQLLLIVGVPVVVAVLFGVVVLITGTDRGLAPAEPDGRAVPLPTDRPLAEVDVARVRFDTGLRGYRMAQVDQALRRAAYDIGYKDELISVLEAEVVALRAGRVEDAEVLRRAREAALGGTHAPAAEAGPADRAETVVDLGMVSPVVADEPAGPADAARSAEPAGEVATDATTDPLDETDTDAGVQPADAEDRAGPADPPAESDVVDARSGHR